MFMRLVLIADDSAGRRLEISEWLQAPGWEIIAAEDADETLDRLHQGHSNVTLMVVAGKLLHELLSSKGFPFTESLLPMIVLGQVPGIRSGVAERLSIAAELSEEPEERILLEEVERVAKK
jgi:CheY-like chemotaxis protein